MARPSYFLVSVSTRGNLELCIKHALAGFTSSINGLWTFSEICEGDFLSFLHAARAHNLYQVLRHEALAGADKLPPWPPVTFRQSGLTYYFPFRLHLKPIRELNEPLVRPEFAYVAENLLLRAGYRKTHFQADQTTLQNVSQMGRPWDASGLKSDELVIAPRREYVPRFTRARGERDVPVIFPFQEVILQAAIRQRLLDRGRLTDFLRMVGMSSFRPEDLEVLGEKAVSQGHVDLLIKESVPIGTAKKLIAEVKLGRARPADLTQLREYMDELGPECVGGVLIAEGFPRAVVREAGARGTPLVVYSLDLDWTVPRSFEEMRDGLEFTRIA